MIFKRLNAFVLIMNFDQNLIFIINFHLIVKSLLLVRISRKLESIYFCLSSLHTTLKIKTKILVNVQKIYYFNNQEEQEMLLNLTFHLDLMKVQGMAVTFAQPYV